MVPLVLLILTVASPAPAQTNPRMPQDPAALTFEVSPDHDASDASGPRVLKYLIDFLPLEGLGIAKTVDIGKPAPEDGVIRVPLAPLKLAPGCYMAQVRVLGPATSVVSGAVGPFQLGHLKRSDLNGSTPAPVPSPHADADRAHGDSNHAHAEGDPVHAGEPSADHPATAETTAGDRSAGGRKGGFWRRLYGFLVGR